ncbi:methionyl-tRNA formyltransferase [Barrientosiimonas marina]|uniref:Methionyl-tRNA formyltransferase n=1 Tax=Lentibacillus kimchii TaxID=1542911 RepID=A0ABW2UPE8_9BACI
MKRVIFMGTPDFAVPILEALIKTDCKPMLVVTQPDRPKGRKKVMTPPPVKEAAEKHALPVLQPEKLKDDYQTILDYEPDIIITAAYGQILPKAILETPVFGCINVHASLLPELRGGAPIHHAILQGKQETGISIMYMDEKMDTGDIISQETVPIKSNDHVDILHDKLAETGARLLTDTLPDLFAGNISPVSQNHDSATYAMTIKRKQEEINWRESHEVIYNHIRGLHPWPVAFTTYNGQVMKIWWGEMDDTIYTGEPGEIVQIIGDDAFIVVCGDQQGIKVTEIQPAGKKRMSVNQYLQGSSDRIKTGTLMGD